MSELYTIISGTNRKGSNTYKVASIYQQLLKQKNIPTNLISLVDLDLAYGNQQYKQLEKEVLGPTKKFIFISPEYNGSIPGVLKSMLDISDYKNVWHGKKALLVGVATGRGGNMRGMEHLTSILHYMKVNVHPDKLPISAVDKLIADDGTIQDEGLLRAIDVQLNDFIQF